MVQRIHDNGHVYAGTYEGYYCPRCADFKTEAELVDGNRCPIHQIELEIEKEDNWFFRLSTFQEPLERLYAERPDFVTPQIRYNEALSFIKSGLHDVSLSPRAAEVGRAGAVGRVPGHLRLDRRAPQLLHGALATRAPGEDLTDKLLAGDVHLIGKDILKFHAVIWPAMLMAAGHRGAAAGRHPRLPAARRAQDVEVARQRDRPVPGGRPLRRRRAALLRDARGELRPRRRGLAGGLRDALQHRARQRVRQPRQPHARDDRPLPRRRRAERRAAGRARGRVRRPRGGGARAPRRGRADGRARRGLAARSSG